jgi:HSP20 family protein
MTVFLLSPALQKVTHWQPAVDVYRTEWGWVLKFELAGVRLEDIHVNVSRRTITVSGIRRDHPEDGCSYYSMEISYTEFKRTVELPTDLEGARMRLDYRDGILSVRIQLKEEQS